MVNGELLTRMPSPVTAELLARGRRRFEVVLLQLLAGLVHGEQHGGGQHGHPAPALAGGHWGSGRPPLFQAMRPRATA